LADKLEAKLKQREATGNNQNLKISAMRKMVINQIRQQSKV
jgi:hypothetical protein